MPAAPKFSLVRDPDVLHDENPMWVRISGTDRAVPSRFEVRAELADPPCLVTLDVRVDREANTPAVDTVVVRRTGDLLEPGPPITGRVVRKLAVDALLRMAIDQIAEPIVTVKIEGHAGAWQLKRDAEEGSDRAYGGRPVKRPRARRAPRQAITEDLLHRVATIYRSADQAPTQAVADQLHVSRSHAGRLVSQARAAGHLGATTPGKAGEQR